MRNPYLTREDKKVKDLNSLLVFVCADKKWKGFVRIPRRSLKPNEKAIWAVLLLYNIHMWQKCESERGDISVLNSCDEVWKKEIEDVPGADSLLSLWRWRWVFLWDKRQNTQVHSFRICIEKLSAIFQWQIALYSSCRSVGCLSMSPLLFLP